MAKKRRNKQRKIQYSTHDLDSEKLPRKKKNLKKDVLHSTVSKTKAAPLSKRQIKKNLFVGQTKTTASKEEKKIQ